MCNVNGCLGYMWVGNSTPFLPDGDSLVKRKLFNLTTREPLEQHSQPELLQQTLVLVFYLMLVVVFSENDNYGVSFMSYFMLHYIRAACQHYIKPGDGNRLHIFSHQFASVTPVRHNNSYTHKFSFSVSSNQPLT